MTDIIFEMFRAVIVGAVLFALIRHRKKEEISRIDGWTYIVTGFFLIFFGMIIDITDNFDSLSQYVIIGDTKYQAFAEKLVGYLLGFLSLAIGISKWIPKLVEKTEQVSKELEDTKNELKTLCGLLPICASCKKIKDDQGSWSQIETYIEKHSEVQFSHGLCEKCAEEIYGKAHWFKNRGGKRDAC